MEDYSNYMPSQSVPTLLKIIFFVLLVVNIYYYKKHQIQTLIEEQFPKFLKTYASLSFLLLTAFIFTTYGRDTYLEVVSIVLGIGICLSYMYNVYVDVENKKIGFKKWLMIICIILVDTIAFCMIPNKIIAFCLAMVQSFICMIYEKKELAN